MNIYRFLQWALASSWLLLVGVAARAAADDAYVATVVFAVLAVLWIVRLCQMFGVLTREVTP
jgi:hypothetical protein